MHTLHKGESVWEKYVFSVDSKMDAVDVKNIIKLRGIGQELAEQHEAQLRKFLKKIVLSNALSCHSRLFEASLKTRGK